MIWDMVRRNTGFPEKAAETKAQNDSGNSEDPDGRGPENEADAEEKILKRRFVLSLVFEAPLFCLCMFSDVKPWSGSFFVCLALLAPIIVLNFKFYRVGYPALFRGGPNMDTLVSVGTTASFFVGYFDSVGMILTLVTLGKWLEAKAKKKTTNSLRELIALTPDTARVIRDGEELIVKVSAVRRGEILLVKPGESIPVDGEIIKGKSRLNQSMLTGESRPVEVSEGDRVIGGTINIDGFFEYKATEIGKDTVLAKIIELVEEATASKAPIARLADKVAGFFVPAVIAIAFITVGIWAIAMSKNGSIDWTTALNFGVSVLVISCPCALGLATPVAIMVGTGRGAKEGILIKSATSLENLGKADKIVFDKTGTLTYGLAIDDVSLEARLSGDKTILNTESDIIREEAKSVIDALNKMGIETVMLSGDKREFASKVAAQIGVSRYYSDVFPDDKERVVRELQSERNTGRRPNIVCMVGDGVNDAPAIARADVGIAIGTGTDIAIDQADLVLMSGDLNGITKAIRLSKATVRNIKGSLFWAFFYNIICIPLAAGAFYPAFGIMLNPMIAAACMSLSSVTVVTNSLRLRKKKI